jgi:hypothetical protein
MTARRTLFPPKDRPELNALLRDAVAKFDAMPLEKQKEMRRAQRKSWVVGEMLLEHPEMTREEAERLYEQVSY